MAYRVERRHHHHRPRRAAAKLPAALLLSRAGVPKTAPTVLPQDAFSKGPGAAPAVALSVSASTLAPPNADLSLGDEGAAVLALQQCLLQLGFLSQADMNTGPGTFGPRTKAALQAFQGTWGVPATGNFGPMSRAAMAKALSGEKPPAAPTYSGASPAPGTTNTNAWIPVNAPVRGEPNNRSAELYDNVINQFAVGVNPRYTPRGGNTYCNIFAWDVTRAMGAEIPHWVDGQGRPVGVGQGRELDANDTNRWLNQHGAQHGWRKVSAAEAQALANQGHPAVASWLNYGGIGHIGVVRPGQENANGPALAQAGAQNFNHGHVYDVFPRNGTEYWVNDSGAVTTSPTTPQPQPTEPSQPTQPSQPSEPAVAGVPQMDLQRGAEGAAVKQLQAALVQLGFMSQADMSTGPGIFGPRTEAALKAFQSANGVPSTGYYGPLSRAALAKALGGAAPAEPQPEPQPPAPTFTVPQTDLEQGASGEAVRQLQANLVHLGFLSQEAMNTGPGEFGPRTKAALQAFQSAWGVPATGYFGPLSRDAMTRALNGATAPAPVQPSGIPGAEEAISYAFNPPPNPFNSSGSWHYWCLGLVNKAYQAAGNPDGKLAAYNAIGAYRNYLNAGEIHTSGTPPRGALVFFTWANDGHIGISLGDGNYIGTLTSGPNTGVRSIYSGSYLGWAYP